MAALEDEAGLRSETIDVLMATDRATIGVVAACAWRVTYGDAGILGQHLGEAGTEVASNYLARLVQRMEAILFEMAASTTFEIEIEPFVFELLASSALPPTEQRVQACAELGIRTRREPDDPAAAERLLVAVGVDVTRSIAERLLALPSIRGRQRRHE